MTANDTTDGTDKGASNENINLHVTITPEMADQLRQWFPEALRLSDALRMASSEAVQHRREWEIEHLVNRATIPDYGHTPGESIEAALTLWEVLENPEEMIAGVPVE